MVAPAGAALRRTWPQRLLIAFNIALILLCLTAASGLGYFYYQFGQLPRIALDHLHKSAPGKPQNFLLVGSDSRAFVEDAQDSKSFGNQRNTGGQRADTIILVRVDPEAHEVPDEAVDVRHFVHEAVGRNDADLDAAKDRVGLAHRLRDRRRRRWIGREQRHRRNGAERQLAQFSSSQIHGALSWCAAVQMR